MIYQDVKWIRAHGAKLAPSLRKHILACIARKLYAMLYQQNIY